LGLRIGRSSNQCAVHIHIDRKLGLFSFSKYYRVNTEAQGMTEKNEDPPYCGYKGERWQPVHHQRYFVILGDGGIRVFRWSGAPFDYAAWQFGNCFKTRRAAERAREAVRQVLGVFHIERER